MNDDTSFIEDFTLITKIGQELSSFFDGLRTTDIIKAKSTYYLAKALNTNFAILCLIPESPYSNVTYQDTSSIYALLRNQIELCNIYWYLLDNNFEEELSALKIDLLAYHDTISCRKVYLSLFNTEETKEYYNEREATHLLKLESNPRFDALTNNQKQQIKKGNVSTLYTQFEIAEKRGFNLEQFKAFYKFFSTHIHSSPMAIQNLVVAHLDSSKEFNSIFFQLSLTYTLSFISDFILSVGQLWEIDFQNPASRALLIRYADQLKHK